MDRSSARAAEPPAEGRAPRVSFIHVCREVIREAGLDGVARSAAALAYFTIFSLPALLVLVLASAGALYESKAVEMRFLAEVGRLVGESGAAAMRDMIHNASRAQDASLAVQLIGVGGLLFGATGYFLQIQDALNGIWGAAKNAKRKGVAAFLFKRMLSFGMILGIALLLLVSLALGAALAAGGDWLASNLPIGAGGIVAAADLVLSAGLVAVLFAAVYKVLPDLKIEWREVWLGAFVGAVLFSAGKFAIGTYLGKIDLAAGYGAAGPLVVVLVWVYVASFALLIGAEFTQVHARLRGPRRAERSRRMTAKAANDPAVHPEKGA